MFEVLHVDHAVRANSYETFCERLSKRLFSNIEKVLKNCSSEKDIFIKIERRSK